MSDGQFLFVGTPVFDSECCSQFIWRSCLYHLPFLSLSSAKECSKYASVSITQTPFFSFFFLQIMSPLTLRCMLCERLSLLPSDLYIYMSGWTLRNECCIQTGTEGKLFKWHLWDAWITTVPCTQPMLNMPLTFFQFNFVPFLTCAYLITKVMTDERWTHPIAFVKSRFIVTPKPGKAIGSQSNKRLWHWWACFPNT